MSDGPALAARARGLAPHLLTRMELEALAASADEAALGRALVSTHKLAVPPAEPAAAAELEVAVQQTAARHLATLRRWGPGAPVLRVFEAYADLRSLRALVRGAVQGAPAAQRVAGLLPTAGLPLKLLEALARQPTPARVAAHLFATGHPDGARLSALTHAKSAPELLELDHALVQGFAARAAGAAKGDGALKGFVAAQLDGSNAAAALALAGAHDTKPERWFVRGGARLTQADFVAAAQEPDAAHAAERLRRARLKGLPAGVTAAQLERAVFRSCLASARAAARLDPLGCGPTLYFLLRLEAMARDVRRLAHGLALGVPRALVAPEWVTP